MVFNVVSLCRFFCIATNCQLYLIDKRGICSEIYKVQNVLGKRLRFRSIFPVLVSLGLFIITTEIELSIPSIHLFQNLPKTTHKKPVFFYFIVNIDRFFFFHPLRKGEVRRTPLAADTVYMGLKFTVFTIG